MKLTRKLVKGLGAILLGLGLLGGGAYLLHYGVSTVREELHSQSQATTTATDKLRRPQLLLSAPAPIREIGIWTLTGRRGPEILWREVLHNALSKIADQRMLENYYRGGAAAGTNFYIALSDTTNPCSVTKTDTLATAVTGEPSGNGYSRSGVAITKDSTGWPTSAASGNDWHIISKTVTYTASGGSIGPVNCAVLTDVASGTTGDWHAFVALSQARTMASGESLDVSLDITLQ